MKSRKTAPRSYDLHLGIMSPFDPDTFPAPRLMIRDGTVIELDDLLVPNAINPQDTRIDLGHLNARPYVTDVFIISGSWQDWAEPTAEDVHDFHLVVRSNSPWVKGRVADVRHLVAERVTDGRVADYMLSDLTMEWGEQQTIWLYDGIDFYEVIEGKR